MCCCCCCCCGGGCGGGGGGGGGVGGGGGGGGGSNNVHLIMNALIVRVITLSTCVSVLHAHTLGQRTTLYI